MEPPFDVFLSYNRQNAAAVREIYTILQERGLRPWLDDEDLRAGGVWQDEIAKAIRTIPVAAILIGAEGPGAWQRRRALDIDQAAFGNEHPDVAVDLNNLAQLLQATNRPSEAEPLMRRALDIFERSLGPDHPNTKIARRNLESLLKAELAPRSSARRQTLKSWLRSALFGRGT